LYATSFGISIALAAMVTTMNALGRISSDIPLGTLCDRIGRRPLAIFGPLLVAVSAVLSGLVQNFYQLLVCRFVTGSGMAMWTVARQTMIADSVDPSIRGRVLSTFQGVNMIGSAAGPAIGGIIAEFYGYRMPFFFYGASVLVSLIVSFLFVKESSNPVHLNKKAAIGTDMRKLLGYLTFPILIAAFANFSNHMRNSARGFILPLYAGINLGLSPGEIGLALSASTVMNICMVFPGGYIVDKLGRKVALVPSFVLAGIVYLFFPFTTDFTSIILTSIALGGAQGIGGGATMTIATDLAPEEMRGQFLGLWNTIGDVGNAIGPLILGIMADTFSLVTPFYFIGALMVIAACTTQVFVKETLEKKSSARS
ncbi:MAG: MFS transporter, partial [Candidatus Bathyarchaeota archaeon]